MSEESVGVKVPWYKDPQWWRDNWPDVIFGVLGAGAAGYLVTLLGQIREMASSYPLALAAFGLVSFSIGVLFGSSRRRHERQLDRMRHEDEKREHVIRAHNLIAQLNQSEARALRSLVRGNNELVVTDPGTTGLLSFGAIKYLADTGSYIPGRGALGYFSVNPLWRLYASWERDLLDSRAEGGEAKGDRTDGQCEDVARIRTEREEREDAE